MRSPSTRLVIAVAALALHAAVAHAADPAAELAESMKKLAALKYYKARNSVQVQFPPDVQRQMDELKAKGMGDFAPKPTVQEVVNPDLRRSTIPQRMPSMSRVPGAPPLIDANFITVMRTRAGVAPQVATYVDCKECEANQDAAMHEMLAKQAGAMARGLVSEVIGSLAAGPLGIAGAVISAARVGAERSMLQGAAASMKENLSLNRWTCRDLGLPAPSAQENATALPSFQNAQFLGERQVGEETVRAYQVEIADQSSGKTSPMTVYTSVKSGLPLKIEMRMDSGEGPSTSMTTEYYDFDVPIQIDVPDCLK